MEEYLLEYLFQSVEDDLLKGNDYQILIYIFRKSYRECWQETIEISSNDASDKIGVSSPTFKKSLERLEFAGVITSKSFKGRNGRTEITLNFIEELLNSRHFDEDSSQHEEKVVNDNAPKTKEFLETRIFEGSRERSGDEFNYKESLQLMPEKYKESLQLRVENIKNLYNLFVLNVKNLCNLDGKCKKSLQLNAPKYKISLHFISSAKSININDLTDVSSERYRNIRSFFAKIGTIYNKKYINIINTIDLVVFDGKLFDAIENHVVEKKAKKGSSKYSSKEFELTEDNKKFVPLDLHDHTENVLTDSGYKELGFMESYRNWLKYKKEEKGQPVGFGSAKRELQWLATLDNPIECIETSIRKNANGIFQPSNYNKKVKGNKSKGGENNSTMNVRRFD